MHVFIGEVGTMTDKNSTQAHVEYTKEANDVHCITFKENTRQAVDAFIEYMTIIYGDVTIDDTVRILVDYRESGLPPIPYVTRRSVQWANRLSIHPPAKLAIVHRPDITVSILSMFVNMYSFGHLSTKFFEGDKGYTGALNWLHAGDKP